MSTNAPMTVELSPLDTFFVGNGKPFAMGEDNWAEELFPPPLSIFAGALRSQFYSFNMDNFYQYQQSFAQQNQQNGYAPGQPGAPIDVTKLDPSADLRIRDLCYWDGQESWLPVPADLVRPEKADCADPGEDASEKFPLLPLALRRNQSISSSPLSHSLTTPPERKVQGAGMALMSLADWARYAAGDSESLKGVSLERFVSHEPKTGIARDRNTRSAQEGRLYRVQMMRLRDDRERALRFAFRLEGLEIPQAGLVKFGAEGKAARYRQISGDSASEMSIPLATEKFTTPYFKIVLLTPSYFRNGWLPGFLLQGGSETGVSGIMAEHKIRLIAAALGKYQPLGGYDMMQRRAKTMQRIVPAGAVYYLQAESADQAAAIAESYHGRAIADDPVMAKLGMGQIAVVPSGGPEDA